MAVPGGNVQRRGAISIPGIHFGVASARRCVENVVWSCKAAYIRSRD
jgi:hypothetical protein